MSVECVELRKTVCSESVSSLDRGVEVLSRSVFALRRLLKQWAQNYRTRNDLAELNEHMLKDIGVTRYQAREEAAKPFWRS